MQPVLFVKHQLDELAYADELAEIVGSGATEAFLSILLSNSPNELRSRNYKQYEEETETLAVERILETLTDEYNTAVIGTASKSWYSCRCYLSSRFA